MPRLSLILAPAVAAAAALTALASPLAAKDSLGVYANWAAFRDAKGPRCYAIARPRTGKGFASVATWPRQKLRNQIHFRLPRDVGDKGANLVVGERRFALATRANNAWAQDRQMDAAIVAAMRSASRMTITARGTDGRSFSEQYDLSGVATAIDAAVLGCARK